MLARLLGRRTRLVSRLISLLYILIRRVAILLGRRRLLGRRVLLGRRILLRRRLLRGILGITSLIRISLLGRTLSKRLRRIKITSGLTTHPVANPFYHFLSRTKKVDKERKKGMDKKRERKPGENSGHVAE